jgi:hypothetical protein
LNCYQESNQQQGDAQNTRPSNSSH